MVKLKIDGMSCGHCVMHVKEALEAVAGVESAAVDLQAGEAAVEGSAEAEALIRAVEVEGYTASRL